MTERRARRRPGENRAHLREAGLIEFGLSGFHGTSTARIAARAGVPQPHVYANFRTKQELFLECVAHAVEQFLDDEATAADELVIFQAYAALPSPAVTEALRDLLAPLTEGTGSDELPALLTRAARALVRPPVTVS